MKYEVLEHKADLKIKAFGKTKEKLFLNMLLGMMESLRPEVRGFEKKIKRRIKIKSLDLAASLVDFLSEALYQSQVNKEIYNEVKFKKLSDNPSAGSGQAELKAELFGRKVERFGEDIKAVTYHGLDFRRKKDRTWEATVLFDI